jgi:IS30 family transposase
MTDALIGDLAKISALRVISRTSVMHYLKTDKSLPEIARELGVDGVIEGTVIREGDRIRVTAQLVDARSDSHVWADRFDRELSSVLTLQSDVARAVTDQIRLELTPQDAKRLGSGARVQPDAYEAYLKGRYLNHRTTHEDALKAVEYFQESIRIDPDFALGYAGLADAYS